MSAPKRATKTTSSKSSPTKKAAAKPAKPAKPVKAAAKPVKPMKKAAAKKTAARSPSKPAARAAVKASAKPSAKPAAKSTAKSTAKATGKPAAKAAKTAKPSAAERVAKKVAKIISKIVSKKKTVAKKPADAVKPKAAKAAAKPAKPKPKAAASRRPKSFAPRDVERDFGFPASAPDLPEFYGEDRLVLMTKDPEYLFAYWEITPEKQAEGEKVKHRREDYREALRLNWASRDILERNFAVMPVTLAARKWYLRVPFPGLAYHVEIGWLGESGHFISLLASNPSDAPESWAATRRRLKATAKSGGILERALAGGRPHGSSDLTSKSAPAAPAPHDWNFPGPLSQTSSFGTAKKPGRRAAAS